MSLKIYKEEYMESFGGKKGREKMMQMYYNLKKYKNTKKSYFCFICRDVLPEYMSVYHLHAVLMETRIGRQSP